MKLLTNYEGAGILFTCEDMVLLGKRSISPYYGYWSIPGGGKKYNESFLLAAFRETEEELMEKVPLEVYLADNLPLDFDRNKVDGCGYTWQNETWRSYWWTFRVPLLKKAKFIPSFEFDEVRWFPLNKLPEPTHFGVDYSLERFNLQC